MLICANVFAQEDIDVDKERSPAITFGSEIDFPSQYVWHGLLWSNGFVMQPTLWTTTYGFTFSAFSNFDLDHQAFKSTYNESDLIIAYRKEWKKIIFEPDFQYYLYPNQKKCSLDR